MKKKYFIQHKHSGSIMTYNGQLTNVTNVNGAAQFKTPKKARSFLNQRLEKDKLTQADFWIRTSDELHVSIIMEC